MLVGGPGLDILYGGPGADQFVIDLIEQEVDEIMDFAPEEGDTLWIQPRRPVRGKKKISSSIGLGQVEVDYKRLTVDNVRLGYNGDVEFRFEGRGWEKIAGIKRSDLKLTVTQEGERLRLRFRRKF